MTPLAAILRAFLAHVIALRSVAHPDPAVPPTDRPGDTHSRKVEPPAERAFRAANLLLARGMYGAAASALLGSTCPSGHCTIIEEVER